MVFNVVRIPFQSHTPGVLFSRPDKPCHIIGNLIVPRQHVTVVIRHTAVTCITTYVGSKLSLLIVPSSCLPNFPPPPPRSSSIHLLLLMVLLSCCCFRHWPTCDDQTRAADSCGVAAVFAHQGTVLGPRQVAQGNSTWIRRCCAGTGARVCHRLADAGDALKVPQ